MVIKLKANIYADNAATTKLDQEAFEAMIPWLTEEYGNASQPYSFARKPKKALYDSRELIAKCINAEPEEIFFTSGGTESDNWAIKGAAFAAGKEKQILTTNVEHHAVLNTCKELKSLGYEIDRIPVDSEWSIIQPDLLHKLTQKPTSVFSMMLANNETGAILRPFTLKTSGIVHEFNTLFHVDAVQAVGHIPIDVKKLDIDMLSASAHKFNGPKGIGFLYVRKGTNIHSFNNGGSQEHGMRAGTENIASIVGMATALENNCTHMVENANHITKLEQYLISLLGASGIDYIRNGRNGEFYGDLFGIDHVPGNLSLSFKNADGEAILHRMDLMGISISTGSACDSVNTQVSHVIKAIGVPDEYAKGTIRISLGKYNTISDCEAIGASLVKILGE